MDTPTYEEPPATAADCARDYEAAAGVRAEMDRQDAR